MWAQQRHVTLIPTAIRDGFCLFYNARTKEIKGLNGSGRSPEKLTIDHVRQRGITGPRIPPHDLNSVTVPGVSKLIGYGKILTTTHRMCWFMGGYC